MSEDSEREKKLEGLELRAMEARRQLAREDWIEGMVRYTATFILVSLAVLGGALVAGLAGRIFRAAAGLP